MIAKQSGRIINLGSIVGLTGIELAADYGAAKGGIISFTKCVAREVVRHGILVNCIAPGFIETPMTAPLTPELRQLVMARTPIGRFGEPRDIAAAALYLACEDSSFMVGQVIEPQRRLRDLKYLLENLPCVMNSRPAIERIAGVMVPLFSLRTRADAGIGDIAALAAMTDLAAAMEHRGILLLPLDETAPGEASPYSALSVFAIDPIYIGLDGLAGVDPQQVERVRGALAHVPLSDRLTIRAARLELLEAAFRHFTAHGDEHAAVKDFAARHREWLDDYALFRALKDRFDFAAWELWPDELRRREPRALERAKADLAPAIGKYVYWQFLAHRQWAELRAHARARGVKLGGDLAFSPARDSAEVWANQELFDLERTVGAPPDDFNPKGQHWGLPAPRWDRIRADGFALLRRRIRHARELYDLIRVDHVVGLYRTFSFDLVSQAEGSFSPAAEPEQRAQGRSGARRDTGRGRLDDRHRRGPRRDTALRTRLAEHPGRAGVQGDALGENRRGHAGRGVHFARGLSRAFARHDRHA